MHDIPGGDTEPGKANAYEQAEVQLEGLGAGEQVVPFHIDRGIEELYYQQVIQTETARAEMERLCHQYRTMEVRMQMTERVLLGQHEYAGSREEAISAITGTISQLWSDLAPQVPFRDASKPEYRNRKKGTNDTWYKLV